LNPRPSTPARRYLEAWVARPSWAACYKSTSLYSAATVMVAAGMIAKKCPEICNDGKDMFIVMERARRLDRGGAVQIDPGFSQVTPRSHSALETKI